MLTTARIKIRDIKELQEDGDSIKSHSKDFLNKTTPVRKRKNQKKAATTSKKPRGTTAEECDTKSLTSDKVITETKKILPKTAKKFVQLEQPSTQKRIHSYFTACAKTYQVKCEPAVKTNDKTSGSKLEGGGGEVTDRNDNTNNNSKTKTTKNTRRSRGKRKRLFADCKTEQTEDNTTISGLNTLEENQTEMPAVDCIIVIDDDDDNEGKQNQSAAGSIRSHRYENKVNNTNKDRTRNSSSSSNLGLRSSKTSDENDTTKATSPSPLSTAGNNKTSTFSRRKLKPCPPYKIIEDTTFAVDAFQFGYIENVTHYFLTHFHADHYIGLTKSFAKPIYMSPITARFLRAFIPIEEQYIHELELNETYTINDIEVTALDANHCPGAILLVFKLPKNDSNNDEQKCILHTGDFRACHSMESEPIFWNNNIHTIYLDTTYISDKYAFCSQYESLVKAKELIKNFQEKHPNQRILYICGSYVIGKEKFWSKLAEDFQLKVWAEGNRYKALKALNDEQINKLLVDQATEANMHVIAMGKLSYLHLLEYFKNFENMYDLVFAIRPSGWEKDARPQYRGKINIVGIEYSEHSSYAEMKRFVKYLKPQKVLSTVPCGRDLMKTSEVPLSWYKYDKIKSCSNYQPTIAGYLGQKSQKKTIRPPVYEMDGMEKFVSPIKFREIATNSTQTETTKCEKEQETPTNMSNKSSMNKTRNANKLQAEHNENNNSLTTCAPKSVTINSSEDFERPEIQVKRKSPRYSKRQLQGKEETNAEAHKTTKVEQKSKKILRKSLKEIQTSPPESKEVYCKTLAASQRSLKKELPITSTKLKSSPKTPIKNVLKNAAKLSDKSDILAELVTVKKVKRNTNKKTLKNIKINYLSSEEFESDTPVPTTRKAETATIVELPASQNIYENSTNKVQLKTSSCTSLQNLKTEKTSTCDEIPVSQRIYENSRSKAPSCTSSENLKDLEFETQLQNITKQSGKGQPSDKPQHQVSMTSRENPLCKSTSTSVASTSAEEIPPFQLCHDRIVRNKFNKNVEEHSTDGPEQKFDGKKDFKNSRQSLHANVFVKTILLNEDALAGVVMESLNEINPNVSKDHIPSDLLSSTDDDVSVFDYKKHKNNMELRCSSLIERKRQSGTSSIPQSSTPLKKAKEALNIDVISVESEKSILDYKSDSHETKLPTSSLNGLNRQSSLSPLAQDSTPLKKFKQPEMLPVTNDTNIVDVQNFDHDNELPSCSSFCALNRKASFSLKHQSSTPLKKAKQTLNVDTVSVESEKSIPDHKSDNHETKFTSSSLNDLNRSSTPSKKSKQPEMLPVTNDTNIVDVQNFNYDNDLPSCSSFCALKRKASFSLKHQSSTPLQKYVNTQALLKTILETKEDLDKYNCSQLAELVVESINKYNPDYSKDHIPADLLSDADDDWM